MLEKPVIMCVDDERDILSSLEYELESFLEAFDIELYENGLEAREGIEALVEEGREIALVVTDQRMPKLEGVDLLLYISEQPQLLDTKIILLTGQASHSDTIRAVNSSRLNYYLSKPWSRGELQRVVKGFLTDYVIEIEADLRPFVKVLDTQKLLEHMATTAGDEL